MVNFLVGVHIFTSLYLTTIYNQRTVADVDLLLFLVMQQILHSERSSPDVPGRESQRDQDLGSVRGPCGQRRAGDGVHAQGFGGRSAADAGRTAAVASDLPHGARDRPGHELPPSSVSSAPASGPEAQQRAAGRQPPSQGQPLTCALSHPNSESIRIFIV